MRYLLIGYINRTLYINYIDCLLIAYIHVVYMYVYKSYICIYITSTYMPRTPCDTLRTWNMVPHPTGEMLSSMNSSNKQRSRKWEKTQKPKIRLVFYHVFSHFYQKSNMILWSIRTFWYKGSAEIKEQMHVRKENLSKTSA